MSVGDTSFFRYLDHLLLCTKTVSDSPKNCHHAPFHLYQIRPIRVKYNLQLGLESASVLMFLSIM